MVRKSKQAKWVTLKEYAQVRGYSPATVQGWCRAGDLKKAAKKKSNRWLIQSEKADQLLGVSVSIDDGYVSLRDYAKRSGESVENVRALKNRGRLDGAWIKNEKGHIRIDVAAADKLRAGSRKDSVDETVEQTAEEESSDVKVGDISIHASTREAHRLEKVYKAKLARIKFLNEEGHTIDRTETSSALASVASALNSCFMGIGTAIKYRLADEKDPAKIQAIVDDECRHTLGILVDAMKNGTLSKLS